VRLSRVQLESKYLAVQELHDEKGYPVTTLCEIIDLNRSSYYKWLRRDQSQQDAEDTKIIDFLGILYEESDGKFGYRSMRYTSSGDLSFITTRNVYTG
jgi:hypothetical protein